MVVPEIWQILFILVLSCEKTPDGCNLYGGNYVHVCSEKIKLPFFRDSYTVFKDNKKKVTFFYGKCRLT